MAVNQVEWHLGWHDESLLEFCRGHGIQLQAHSPLGGAFAAHASVPMDSPALLAVARAHNASSEQAVLRWSIQRGVPVVTTAPRNLLAKELGPLFQFSLTAPEIASLDGLVAATRAGSAPAPAHTGLRSSAAEGAAPEPAIVLL